MFKLWLVEGEAHRPVVFTRSHPSVEDAFISAGKILKSMGAPVLDAQNLPSWAGGRGVRVFDPTGTVGMSAIIEGGFLVEDGVAVEASERLGLVPMTEPQSE